MKQALRQLINDFLSTIFFLAVYSLTGSIVAGTTIGIAVGATQFIRLKRARRAIEPMQWTSLSLVLVLGTATLLTQSPRFMMLKPSFVHFAIAAVMLRRGWMTRDPPAIVHENVPEAVIVGAGYGWAGLMAGLGVANIIIATQLDIRVWAWFISFGAIGAKLAALLLQYAVFRIMIRRRLRRSTRTAEAVATSRIVALAEEAVIQLPARTGMTVIPAQAGIQATAATAGAGQARSAKPLVASATCSTVDPGLRRDDAVSILAQRQHQSEPETASTNWITASEAGAQGNGTKLLGSRLHGKGETTLPAQTVIS